MKFDIEFNVEPQRFTMASVSDKPATLVDWVLMIETLSVKLKARFADQVSELWDKKKGFTDGEKMMLLKEIDKLEGIHPNAYEHDEILNKAVMKIAEKLELKNNMEHMN